MHVHICQRCGHNIEIVGAGDHCLEHRERDTCLAFFLADEAARKKLAADVARKVDAFVNYWRGSRVRLMEDAR